MEIDFLKINLITDYLANIELINLIELFDLIGWIFIIYAARLILNLINKEDLTDLINLALTKSIKAEIEFVKID